MAARGRCPECGSEALVEDSHYAQQQLVCASCGCVVSEGLLTTTYTEEEQLREVAYSQSTGQKEQLSRCLQRGIRRVQDLCKVLQLPGTFEETSVSYFQRALQHPRFHLLSLEKKELLGGCCVFVTCRQHNWPLTMGTICSLLYAKQELFAGVFLSLQKELGLSVPALSLADLVKTHLNGFRLCQRPADVPAPFVEDKEQLVTRTLQLVELAGDTWLVTGRHPVPIVTAAAFLAWQSLRPCPRLSCSLARFCRLADLDLPPPARLRLNELLDVLLRMASQLAWLRVFHLNKKSVVKHVGDLLQHRIFLLRNAFCQEGEEERGEADPGQGCQGQGSQGSQGQGGQECRSTQGSQGQGTPGQGCLTSLDQDTPGQDPPGQGCQSLPGQGSQDQGCQRSLGQDSQDQLPPGQGCQDSQDQDLSGNGSQDQLPPGQGCQSSPGQGPPPAQQKGHPSERSSRRPLLPPCLLKPRKRLRTAAPSAWEAAVTGDEPISDGEIEQYLRSPEEIRAFRRAKAWQ